MHQTNASTKYYKMTSKIFEIQKQYLGSLFIKKNPSELQDFFFIF